MNNRRGFTLTEALVSLAVVGALAVVTAPLYINSDILEKLAIQKMDLAQLERSLELYRSENYDYPPWMMCFDCSAGVPANGALPYSFLTTPIDYLPSKDVLVDKFTGHRRHLWYRLPGTPGQFCWNESQGSSGCFFDDFSYRSTDLRSCDDFVDLYHEQDSYMLFGSGPNGNYIGSGLCNINSEYADRPYDPTNGLISNGKILNFGPREATPSPLPSATPTPTITPTSTMTPTPTSTPSPTHTPLLRPAGFMVR